MGSTPTRDMNLRDVGVTGSNPATPTIEITVFFELYWWGPGSSRPLGFNWGPVSATSKERRKIGSHLSLHGRPGARAPSDFPQTEHSLGKNDGRCVCAACQVKQTNRNCDVLFAVQHDFVPRFMRFLKTHFHIFCRVQIRLNRLR